MHRGSLGLWPFDILTCVKEGGSFSTPGRVLSKKMISFILLKGLFSQCTFHFPLFNRHIMSCSFLLSDLMHGDYMYCSNSYRSLNKSPYISFSTVVMKICWAMCACSLVCLRKSFSLENKYRWLRSGGWEVGLGRRRSGTPTPGGAWHGWEELGGRQDVHGKLFMVLGKGGGAVWWV